jgi:hypothetical protein
LPETDIDERAHPFCKEHHGEDYEHTREADHRCGGCTQRPAEDILPSVYWTCHEHIDRKSCLLVSIGLN